MLQSSTIKCKAVKALIQDASNSFQSPVQSGPKQSGVCFTVHILFLCAFVQQLKLNSMQGCALASVMYPMHCSQRSAKNWRGCTVHFQMKQLVMDQDLMHQFILILIHSPPYLHHHHQKPWFLWFSRRTVRFAERPVRVRLWRRSQREWDRNRENHSSVSYPASTTGGSFIAMMMI